MIAAAAADVATLTVAAQPWVAIIGTGDELAPPGVAYRCEDAIPERLTFGLAAMAEEAGGKVASRAIGLDDLTALEAVAGEALKLADLVIVTGGASVGERDFAKPMFPSHGLELAFAKVAINRASRSGWAARAESGCLACREIRLQPW